jgi:phosphoglycerate kinase
MASLKIRTLDEGDFQGKRVLLRVDINSPVDRRTRRITNDTRIRKSIATIRELSDKGAKLVIMAHQGDTTDYASLISLREHAEALSEALGTKVGFIEDLAGPAAVARIESLNAGEILLLDNLRYFTEEVSTFEDSCRLSPDQMKEVYLVRRLASLFDCYVNDAFSAAHRSAPSMVAFQELLPSYGGRLLIEELTALQAITDNAQRPCVYLLGGSRAGDAFGMIERVLSENRADRILTGGLVGQIFLMAGGTRLGDRSEQLISEKGYDRYVERAEGYLSQYESKILRPVDVAFATEGKRTECPVGELPVEELLFDVGSRTISLYSSTISQARTVFMNGPLGVYEEEISSKGTCAICKAVENAEGFTVIGGGDTVTCFTRYTDLSKISYTSTAGGALIRYLSGTELPLLSALERAYNRFQYRR